MDMSGPILPYLATAVPIGLLIFVYCYYKNAFKYWKQRGVDGPEPWPLVGNMAHIVLNREVCLKWMKRHGKVYGIYEGNKPALVVADPEALRQMAIKDFASMPDHPQLAFMSDLQKSFLFLVQGEQWRKQRTLMSGTFTSGKMRRMFKLLDVCAEDMLQVFKEQLDRGKTIVHLKDSFSLFTMDAIASCCYGLKLERYKTFEGGLKQAATRDGFVKEAMKIFELKIWRLLVMLCVNDKILGAVRFNFISNSTLYGFSARIKDLIRKRRTSSKHFDDYLQTLLDAKLDAKEEEQEDGDSSANGRDAKGDDGLDSTESHHLGATGADNHHFELSEDERKRLKSATANSMSEIEILSCAMFLLIVGLETTASLLTHCFYTLSFHPQVQEKLYETVKLLATREKQTDGGSTRYTFDYDSLISCEYLDAVVCETFRRLTPVAQTDRKLIEDYYLKTHDIHLPAGTKIVFHLGEIMVDKDNWPEPEKFDPERFMPGQREKIVPGSYCPFGLGPRHCLGMRFSLTESKLALAKLLMEFKFEPAPGLAFPPAMKSNFGLTGIKRPEVRVVRR